MNTCSITAYPLDQPPWCELRGDAAAISLGRIGVAYLPDREAPQIAIAEQLVPIAAAPPAGEATLFALAAGPDHILIADRPAKVAMLVPREGSSLRKDRALVYVTAPDPRCAGQFCVTVHRRSPPTGVVYVAQAFGHTTGWVPAVHGALAGLPHPMRFTAAIRRAEDAAHARRKAAGGPGEIHIVPLHYSDTESATITRADVANASRPELLNREAALLWIADNSALAEASAGAAVIVNDCRPETWILHQLAENAQQKDVPLHAVRYAFEEFAWLRRLTRQARSSQVTAGIAELVAASAPAIHTRQELGDALRAAGIDARRNPSADFEGASREILAGIPASGTIWYQAINWRDCLSLESGSQPYVVIPPLGQPCALSPAQAAARAGAVLARRWPSLEHVFSPGDPRGVVLVAQGNGFSACSRRHWRAMLALAARMEETQFLLAGGSAEDRAWLSSELEGARRANVTLLGWLDEDWRTFLRALAAKPRASFVCRPGLSSIGAALVNGVPPLLMSPDPLDGLDGAGFDAITAEVAMERAVYAFQLAQLYATRCAPHGEAPLPVLLDTLGADPAKVLATLRRAVDPAIQSRQRAAIDGYCDWSRVAHLVASVLAREAASGALPIGAKRRLRDQALSLRRRLREAPDAPGALGPRAHTRPLPPHGARHRDGMRQVPLDRQRRALMPEHE